MGCLLRVALPGGETTRGEIDAVVERLVNVLATAQ